LRGVAYRALLIGKKCVYYKVIAVWSWPLGTVWWLAKTNIYKVLLQLVEFAVAGFLWFRETLLIWSQKNTLAIYIQNFWNWILNSKQNLDHKKYREKNYRKLWFIKEYYCTCLLIGWFQSYRVFLNELDKVICLWQIEICKLDLISKKLRCRIFLKHKVNLYYSNGSRDMTFFSDWNIFNS